MSSVSWLVVGAALSLAVYFPIVQAATGKWYPDVWLGLRDAGEAHVINTELGETGNRIALYSRMIVAPVTILLLPLTPVLWPRLSTLAQTRGIVCMTLAMALSIARGSIRASLT